VAFRRKSRERAEEPAREEPAAVAGPAATDDEQDSAEPERSGPLDRSDIDDIGGYLDFGGLLIPAVAGIQIRLEQEEKTRRIVALSVLRGTAKLQLRAFAAPRSGGMWEENRRSILEQVAQQGGTVEEVVGRYGEELHARLRIPGNTGAAPTTRSVRFAGIEGPRWLVHAVFSTEAPGSPDWEPLEEVLAAVVVMRGAEAMPAGAMLTLRPPPQAEPAPEVPSAPKMDQLQPGARITEVR
jgi:hypothetical protein